MVETVIEAGYRPSFEGFETTAQIIIKLLSEMGEEIELKLDRN